MFTTIQNQMNENNVQLHVLVIDGTDAKKAMKYSYDKHKSQKPRRNKSAFLLFSAEKRAQIKAQQGKNLNSNQIMAILADLWNNLPQKERKSYEAGAKKDKERYLQEMETFKRENPSAMESHNRTKANHVKKPCSAYGLFLKDATADIKKGNSKLLMADVLKVVSQRWKNISEEEKLRYQAMAQKEKEMSQAKLGYKLLQSHKIDLETLVNQTNEKQLAKVSKKVKRETSDTVSTNSHTFSLYTPSYERESQEDFSPVDDNFKCFNFDSFEDGFLSPKNFDSVAEFEPIQMSEFQMTTTLPQTQEWNVPVMSNLFPGDELKEEHATYELPNMLENFRTSSQFYMNKFGENENLPKADNFNSFSLNLPELSLSTFPSVNNHQDFSFQGNWTNSFQH